jgi:24-methylenesterol C-methyltransferase
MLPWQVHHMLVSVAQSLIKGGTTGTFTPMHMLVFKKPEAASKK